MSTTSDLALLRRKLAAADYSPDAYVKEIATRCVGGHELHLQRKNIQTLSEDTHSQLKKNVYQNYGQFISTAKEISSLEDEMYKLSHMITEQRNLLQRLAETSILGDKVPLSHELNQDKDGAATASAASGGNDGKVNDKHSEDLTEKNKAARLEFDEGRRKLYDLLEKVEGCSHVTDVPTRFLLHDGALVEMDIAENTALHRVHGYLMNDGFMVATWLPNRRGPVRFKFSYLYELDSLAVVNVRDLGGIKHAFKLLVFPDARLFQCANGDAKQDWMKAFEEVKKRRQKELETAALKRSDTITQRERKRMRNRIPFLKGESTESSANPFGEVDEDEAIPEEGEANGGNRNKAGGEGALAEEEEDDDDKNEFDLPEWLAELPDDLEVFIAQREFESAVNLVFRAQNFCASNSDSPHVRVAATKLEARTKHLLGVLEAELATDKSAQAGPRAARRAVQLLVKLRRSSRACDLFLQHRRAILHGAMKGVKLDSATVPYVHRIAVAFFANLVETSVEFRKAFAGLPAMSSSFLTWLEEEVSAFADRVERQIFSPSTPLEIIASCLGFVREQAVKTQEQGLDLTYMLDNRFRRNIERTICEHRDKHVEAVKLRAQEDRWDPINCFNASGTERFLEEMSAAGIPSVRAYVYDECWVALTRNTTSFSLSYLSFADCLLKLFNFSLRSLINESLVTVFHSHLRHIEQAVRSERLKKTDPKFVQRNAAFLLDTLLSLVEHKYQERTSSDCPKLGKLHSSYTWLKDGKKQPASSSSGTPKTSSAGSASGGGGGGGDGGNSGGAATSAATANYTDPNYV